MENDLSKNPVKKSNNRIRLPFEKRPSDPGVWSYIHRRGIAITVIAYLIFGIIFVSAKITIGKDKGYEGILIDFGEEEQVVRELEERIHQMREIDDYRDVRNFASNENAELNAQLRDDRGTNASEIYNDASSLDDKMQANREAYEQARLDELALIEAARNNSGSAETTVQDRKVEGRVVVSFSFDNPVRTSRNIVVPAYKCEGAGTVVVNATLDNNGNVVSAVVDKNLSSRDECMQTNAVSAARASKFNLDTNAPSRHKGTITYIFIPQ